MPSYNDRLRRDRNFTNPYALEHMVSAFSLEELGTMFKRPPYPLSPFAAWTQFPHISNT